jgi:hypothetical protein
MRLLILASSFLLCACAEPGNSEAPFDEALPPPSTLSLTSDGGPVIGYTYAVTVTGDLLVGEQVHVLRSAGTAAGVCPARLGGNCLELDAPLLLAGSTVVEVPGEALVLIDVPATAAPARDWWFQAVVVRGTGGADSGISNPLMGSTASPVWGCTDDEATNHNASANLDDGTCTYPPVSPWIAYDFTSVDWKNGCLGGAKYVRPSGYASAPFVGVQLCSASRYKIFLGQTMDGTFYGVADQCGSGEDHCELVGGVHTTFFVDYGTGNAGQPGYHRCHAGEAPVFITWTSANWTPSWNECGVSVP